MKFIADHCEKIPFAIPTAFNNTLGTEHFPKLLA
jgi:hypothetical protein